MILCFNEFKFDTEQLLLEKQDRVISLSEKPAQLLALLVENPNIIFNKEQLLDQVWKERAISEQVVFQNISYLRSLFGADSIKTFVKKGYQWQLPLTEEFIENNQSKSIKPIKRKAIAVLTVLLVIAVTFIWQSKNKSLVEGELSLSQSSGLVAVTLDKSGDLIEYSALNSTEPLNLASQRLFDSPFSTWQAVSRSERELVLAHKFYPYQNNQTLRFILQGKYRSWQGYIVGSNEEQRNEQLSNLIALLAKRNFFTVPSDHTALTILNTLSEPLNNNTLLMMQQIEMNYQLGYQDRAIAQIDTLLEAEPAQITQGILQMRKGMVKMRNTQWQDAESHLIKAIQIFEELSAKELLAKAHIQLAWFELHAEKYSRVRKNLALAITNARTANEPLLEYQAHITQSSLAGKHGETLLMQHELEAAEQIFQLQSLAEEHRLPMYFLQAALTELLDEKHQHYMKVLSTDYSPLYQERFYYATKRVVEYFVSVSQFERALLNIPSWIRGSYALLLQSYIASAQNQTELATQKAVLAFRQAQLDYQLVDALDAALLLLQYNENKSALDNPQHYIDYIHQNANHRWLRDNQAILKRLKIID